MRFPIMVMLIELKVIAFTLSPPKWSSVLTTVNNFSLSRWETGDTVV